MVRLFLFPLILLLPAGATAAPVLRVSIAEGLDCPSSQQLLKSLSQRFGADRIAAGQPAGDELGLSLKRLGLGFQDELELDLVSKPGESPYRRRLPAGEGSCADLAETVGLVVDAWLRDLPWHGVGFLRDVPEAVQPGPTQSVPALQDLPHAEARNPGPSPPTVEHGNTLTLRLGGGASLGSDTSQFGPEATLSADLSLFKGLGAAVFATILENAGASDRLSSATAASISVSRQVLAVAARYAFSVDNGPRLFAGLALQALESRSSGYTVDPSSFELVPAGFAGALWQQSVWGRLSVYAQLSCTLGPRVDFDVFQTGVQRPVLSLPPVWFDASLGVALKFL